MRIYSFILLSFLIEITTSCTKQNNNQFKNENSMFEKYDFEIMKASISDKIVEKNGWKIIMEKISETGAGCFEYPPSPAFYYRYKHFHSNGMIEERGEYIMQGPKIGIWQYFDEKGNLIEEKDEDKKFGKIKPKDILKFIEKEGWINLLTGTGREELMVRDDGSYWIINARFKLGFIEIGEEINELDKQKNKHPLWYITINPEEYNDFYRTIYKIDRETGEVLEKEVKQIFPEE
jgi:predicted RNA binding protein YcfA (HicA-like mRNA interferase family)